MSASFQKQCVPWVHFASLYLRVVYIRVPTVLEFQIPYYVSMIKQELIGFRS